MALIRREQEGGKLVAMTGDGTNDAPALAQADVGVAMNTGTSAAKEAGNMVDLDSDPTKLIEIVEIGKQLLITRGALTTFSIANDVAKYFAIIPAMFVGRLSRACDVLNVMGLHCPAVGDPLGDHLQRADHRRADPARPARRAVPPRSALADAPPQPLRLRPRRPDRCRSSASSSSTSSSSSSPGSGDRHDLPTSSAVVRQYCGRRCACCSSSPWCSVSLYPLAVTGVGQLLLPRPGERLAGHAPTARPSGPA